MIHTTAGSDGLAAIEEYEGRSLWLSALALLLRNKAAVASMVVLGIIALLAVFPPLLTPHASSDISCDPFLSPPLFYHVHCFFTSLPSLLLFFLFLFSSLFSLSSFFFSPPFPL